MPISVGRLSACTFAVSILMAVPAVASAAPSGPTYSDDSIVVVTFSDTDTKPTVLIAISSDTAGPLIFQALLSADGKTASTETVNVVPSPASIGAHTTLWVALTFERSGSGDAQGFLVVSIAGVGSDSRPLRISSDDGRALIKRGDFSIGIPFPGGPGGILLAAVIISGVLVVGRLLSGKYNLRREMGKREWKLGESWASTFTAVGALLGTVLAAGVLPDTTDLLTKTQYAGVNVLFAIILVMSGFLFDALRKRNGYGRAWVYFICVFMIFTAVFGELLTLFLLIADSAAAFASAALTWTLRAFAVLALVLVFGYGIRSIDEAYQAGIRMVRVRHRPPVRGSLSEIFRMRAAFGDIEELSIVEPGEPGDEAKEPSPPTAETDVPLSWVMP